MNRKAARKAKTRGKPRVETGAEKRVPVEVGIAIEIATATRKITIEIVIEIGIDLDVVIRNHGTAINQEVETVVAAHASEEAAAARAMSRTGLMKTNLTKNAQPS